MKKTFRYQLTKLYHILPGTGTTTLNFTVITGFDQGNTAGHFFRQEEFVIDIILSRLITAYPFNIHKNIALNKSLNNLQTQI